MKIISLSGGLGNQLFQYAVALNSREPFELEWKLGFASENILGEPEIFTFSLPSDIVLSSRRRPKRFEIRVHHWLLVVGASRSRIPALATWTLKIFSSAVLRNYFGKYVMPNIPSSLGFDPSFEPESGDLLIGYFHSYRWIENQKILLQMRSLEIREPSPQLGILIHEASTKRVLIVHIRLGDYEKEFRLGILSENYYREAIQKAHQISQFDEIWVFTNDQQKSRTIFPPEWTYKSRWITEVDHSASETFKVMQNGQGYILGNSTYSWWAAMLSTGKNPLIIAPSPWFKEVITPKDLIPPSWVTVKSDFVTQKTGGNALDSQE